MKIWDKFKTWFKCKKEGRMQEYDEYKQMINLKKDDIARAERYIIDYNERLEYLKEKGYSENSKEFKDAKEDLQKWIYSLDELKLQLEFIRPNSEEDIEYRETQTGSEFVEKLKTVKSDKLNLVFHGTPIYFAREILKSGKITSSADRYDGYIKSTDLPGEISVSDIDSLSRSLNFFSDKKSYQSCLPSGCIFAMYPKDDNDFNKKASTMSSVDFRKNPEQLYGIFTTPENVLSVKKWIEELGLNPNLVYDFDGFIRSVENTSQALDSKDIFRVSEDIIQRVDELSVKNTQGLNVEIPTREGLNELDVEK